MNKNLTKEKLKLRKKLQNIRNSDEVQEIMRCLYAQAENLGAIDVKSRIKREDSAIKKFETKHYKSAERMDDLCGLMVLVDNEEDIYKLSTSLRKVLPNYDEVDYVKNPKAGYRSLHINSSYNNVKDLNGANLPVEIQVKTLPMYIAQESIHNTIYKNSALDENIREELSTKVFPLVEKTMEMKKYIDQFEIHKARAIKVEIDKIKKDNEILFDTYSDILNRVWKNVDVLSLKKEVEKDFQIESFLSKDTNAEKKKKEFKLTSAISDRLTSHTKTPIIANRKAFTVPSAIIIDSNKQKLDELSVKKFSTYVPYRNNRRTSKQLEKELDDFIR